MFGHDEACGALKTRFVGLIVDETNSIKRDQIAARQLHALRQHYSRKLSLVDVIEMFVQMRDARPGSIKS